MLPRIDEYTRELHPLQCHPPQTLYVHNGPEIHTMLLLLMIKEQPNIYLEYARESPAMTDPHLCIVVAMRNS
jgi:hypothetical protein